MARKYEGVVALGVKHADEVAPNWRDMIDWNALDMLQKDKCIAGQLKEKGVKNVDPWDANRGFSLVNRPSGAPFDSLRAQEWVELGNEWRRQAVTPKAQGYDANALLACDVVPETVKAAIRKTQYKDATVVLTPTELLYLEGILRGAVVTVPEGLRNKLNAAAVVANLPQVQTRNDSSTVLLEVKRVLGIQ